MTLTAELVDLLGTARVLDHPLRRHVYGKDGGVTRGDVELVCLPDTTSEVVEIVRIARRHGLPVIPRGAGTGLAGGAVPLGPAVMIVLTRMDRIEDVDVESKTAWVGPGVINLELSQHTHRHGLHYAPDPSSQSTCTVGGNVATNAGGLHCLAEGTTVAHVLAVEMVTADGEVVTLGGEAPDPIGLDLRAVAVGSEGTLGVVTRVLVRLTENAPASQTLLLAFDDIENAAATVSAIISEGIVPGALEMMDRVTVEAVENYVHAGFPTEAAAVLLAEIVGTSAGVAAEANRVASIARANGAIDVEIASSPAQAALWWKGRKSAFGAVAQAAPDYYLHDTVVPRTKLVEVLRAVYAIGRKYDLLMMNVFHAGDGNLHPLMAYDSAQPGVLDRVHAAAEEIVRASIAAGGALSGEHGIGIEKRDLMGLTFGPVDLDAQARLREAFDPEQVFNPGKVLPEGSRCFDYGRPPVGAEA
ncbi:MAG: FAD-binding protein [Acidimicrobiia bacterium]|nr:FAD-binding protein [Acidimicrobiia bacterium]